MIEMKRLFGSELKVGDVIEVWWQPGKDSIVSLKPYTGSLAPIFEPEGAQLAEFAISKTGMTIENRMLYTKVNL